MPCNACWINQRQGRKMYKLKMVAENRIVFSASSSLCTSFESESLNLPGGITETVSHLSSDGSSIPIIVVMALAWCAILPALAFGTVLRTDVTDRLHAAEDILLRPSAWSIRPAPLLPPRFLIVSSPAERIISYAQVTDDYRAVKGLVKPLIKGGVSSPKGLAFDARHNLLFVADPGMRRIRSWRLFLERCFTPAEKAGFMGAAVSDPFATDSAEGPTACDLPWTLWAGEEMTVVDDVSSEWVSLDHNGNLYYSDQLRKTVNRIGATLLLNLVHGEITPDELKQRSAAHPAESLEEEGKKAMQIKPHLHDLGQNAEALGNAIGKLSSTIATPLSLVSQESSEEVIVKLFEADDAHYATPAGVVSDAVQVYWANQDHGLERGSVGTTFVKGAAPSNKLTTMTASSFGIAATASAVLFSNGAGVYGVPKFGGGNATALNEGFILSRGLVWDGSGTVFVADEGASTVYAMPCGVLAEQPLQPVFQMHGAFGLALVQPTDPLSQRSLAQLKRLFPIIPTALLALQWFQWAMREPRIRHQLLTFETGSECTKDFRAFDMTSGCNELRFAMNMREVLCIHELKFFTVQSNVQFNGHVFTCSC